MANLFLDAKDLLQQNNQLNYINYDTLAQEKREFLSSNLWDFEWTKPCNAVYFPGQEFVRARTKSVNPQFTGSIGQMSAVIRNYTIYQAVFSGTTEGTLTFEFQDFEDQSIMAWLDDWRQKLGDRSNKFAFRKEDTSAEGKLTLFNSSRKAIRTYTFRCIQPQDISTTGLYSPSLTSDDPTDLGSISATFHFEHAEITWENQ